MEDEKDCWEKLYPKVVRTEHPGPRPESPTAEQLVKWNEDRKAFNKSLFAERKHIVAVSLDEMVEITSKSPVERIVMILGTSYLRGELTEKDESLIGSLLGTL